MEEDEGHSRFPHVEFFCRICGRMCIAQRTARRGKGRPAPVRQSMDGDPTRYGLGLQNICEPRKSEGGERPYGREFFFFFLYRQKVASVLGT